MHTEKTTTKSDTLPPGYSIAGRYRVLKRLGHGGMGAVYLASDSVLGDEPVAVKVLHTGYQHDSDLMQRFLREVQLMRRVSHKNVVRTYDVGSDGQLAYFTMEYIPGTPLDTVLEKGSFPKKKIASLALQIADALHAIHSAGIVHRDLKPANVILLKDGSLRITDFGVARPEVSDMTGHNEILGSVCYIAPEVWLGEPATPSVDLYGLGIILYEIVTGDVPFDGGATADIMRQHLDRKPTPPKEIVATTPVWLNNLIVRLLEKSPTNRFASALELLDYIKLHSGSTDETKAVNRETGSFINELEATSQLLVMAEARSVPAPASVNIHREKPPAPFRTSSPVRSRGVRVSKAVYSHKQTPWLIAAGVQVLRGSAFFAFAALMISAVFRLLRGILPNVPPATAQFVESNPSAYEDIYKLSSVLLSGGLQTVFFIICLSVPPLILVMACRGWSAIARSFTLSVGFFSLAGLFSLLSALVPLFGNDFHSGISLASAGASAKSYLMSLALLSPSLSPINLETKDWALLASTSDTIGVLQRPALYAGQILYLCVLWLILSWALKAAGRRQTGLPALLVLSVGILTTLESLLLTHSPDTVFYWGGINWAVFFLGAILLATAPAKHRSVSLRQKRPGMRRAGLNAARTRS